VPANRAERAERLLPTNTETARRRGRRYALQVLSLPTQRAVRFELSASAIVVQVNRKHPFFRDVYSPLLEASARDGVHLRENFELMLLALARIGIRMLARLAGRCFVRFML